MIKRPALVALAGITALAGLVSTIATIAPPAEAARKPKISSARATPSTIAGSGQSVQITVTVQPNGAVVSGATVRVSPGGTGTTVSLQSIGNNQYRGNVSVAANPSTKRTRRVSFVITASTNRGSAKRTLVLTQAKGTGIDNESNPPAPPNI